MPFADHPRQPSEIELRAAIYRRAQAGAESPREPKARAKRRAPEPETELGRVLRLAALDE